MRITYDYTGTLPAVRKLCRDLGEHTFPPAGQEGQEQPGTYECEVCGTEKIVKEALLSERGERQAK